MTPRPPHRPITRLSAWWAARKLVGGRMLCGLGFHKFWDGPGYYLTCRRCDRLERVR